MVSWWVIVRDEGGFYRRLVSGSTKTTRECALIVFQIGISENLLHRLAALPVCIQGAHS